MKVKFYENVSDELLKFAVIVSKSEGRWVFCRHKERDTYEVPGRAPGKRGIHPAGRRAGTERRDGGTAVSSETNLRVFRHRENQSK